MIPMDHFYHIRYFFDDIRVCFIRIPDFIRTFVPSVDPGTYGRQRQVPIGADGGLGLYFNDEEILTVNRFKVLKKQMEWMAGKAALKILAVPEGDSGWNTVRIAAETNGAPYLVKNPDLPVTISHSGEYAVAGIGNPGVTVALDIEKIEEGRMRNIMTVAFSDREISMLEMAGDRELYLNWTMKEAYLKYIRKGFAEGLKKVEIIDGRIEHNGVPVEDILIHTDVVDNEYAFTLIRSG